MSPEQVPGRDELADEPQESGGKSVDQPPGERREDEHRARQSRQKNPGRQVIVAAGPSKLEDEQEADGDPTERVQEGAYVAGDRRPLSAVGCCAQFRDPFTSVRTIQATVITDHVVDLVIS